MPRYSANLTSLLFVPANRPERFIKALNSGASAIIIDLEDAVAHTEKQAARQFVLQFDQTLHNQTYWVRVNNDAAQPSLQTQDLELLKQCQHLAGVMLPKAGSQAEIEVVHTALNAPVIAVIETPKALLCLAKIAQATGLMALSFGLLDLGNHFGVMQGSAGAQALFDKVRYEMVVHSAAFGLAAPIETIFADFKDESGLIRAASHAYEMGFGGQLCVHPSQVASVNVAYTPKDNILGFASKVLAEYERTGKVAFAIDGVMVDLPVIEWAKNALKEKAMSGF